MREIKFRAWDKERSEMRKVELMDWSAWWVSTGSTWERGKQLEYGERNSFKNEETDRHTLMQYTGLKDKNGKEIYEGDIIGIPVMETQFHEGKVTWNSDKAEYRLKFKLYDMELWTSLKNHYGEITGNIYENPELLK